MEGDVSFQAYFSTSQEHHVLRWASACSPAEKSLHHRCNNIAKCSEKMVAIMQGTIAMIIYDCTGVFGCLCYSQTQAVFHYFVIFSVTPCVNVLSWVTGSLIILLPPTPLQGVDKSYSKQQRTTKQYVLRKLQELKFKT